MKKRVMKNVKVDDKVWKKLQLLKLKKKTKTINDIIKDLIE